MVEERMEAPADVQGDSAGGQPVSPEDRERFEVAGAAALAYVNENRTPYGGPMARRELAFEILETQRLGTDTRVRIGYRPAKGFSGRPGEEWILVDSDGDVRARELISRPKESQPWVLIVLAALSVVGAVVVNTVLVMNDDPTGDPLYRAGRILWMRASQPDYVDEVQYSGRTLAGDNVNFRIAGPADGGKLAVVHVSLFNQTSQQVSVNINEEAAVLIDEDGNEYSPVNVVERSVGMAGPIDSRYRYPDFIGLWRSIVIRGAESVAGMLLFEVPSDFEAYRMTWKASDTIQVGFQD